MRKIFNRIFNLTPTRKWFEVKNISDKVVEISIMDDIGGWGVSARHLVDQIKSIGENTRIKLHIFSPGGDVLEGNEIYNALKEHKGGVDVTLGALCASIATVIACSGETISMAKNGLYMIHEPWTIVLGDAEDLRRTAGIMDKLKANIVDVYHGRTKLAAEELSTLMAEETWLTADEAKAKGFIDSVGEEDPDAAQVNDRFDLGRFKNSAKAISRLPKKTLEQQPPGESRNANPPAVAKKQEEKPKLQKPKSPTLVDLYKSGSVRIFSSLKHIRIS